MLFLLHTEIFDYIFTVLHFEKNYVLFMILF